MSDLKSRFEKAAEDVKTLTERPDNEAMLALYAHFKQATQGDVSGSRPGMMNMVARAKYDAWANLEGTSSDDAMEGYIGIVEGLMG